VLTTSQLITLSARPERSVDYRLARLRSASLAERTRPYAATGSAPFHWWLTRAGARLVEGTSPAPGRGAPNPLFVRHTAAIAGLYVALRQLGSSAGLTALSWARDEECWEDWIHLGQAGRIRPDAYVELEVVVDGEAGRAGAFVEVDFATMDQTRLRAKAARHRRYVRELVWWDRHPCVPALLLVTTSDARVNRFLAGVEKDRSHRSSVRADDPEHVEQLVAACAVVTAPEEAVGAPVWRAGVADAPMTLISLLSPGVRTYRRLVAHVAAAEQAQAEHRRRHRIDGLLRHPDAIAAAMGDERASAAVAYVLGGPLRGMDHPEQWALRHLDLVEATADWWSGAQDGADEVPARLVAAWRGVYLSCWRMQAEGVLGDNEAVRLGDPRLRRPAAKLAAGALVPDHSLRPVSPIDGAALAAEELAEHSRRRDLAVTAQLHALPLHRRLRADRDELEAIYDAEHLLVCQGCALPYSHERDPSSFAPTPRCRCCGGDLVHFAATELPPPLDESVSQVAARKSDLRGAT
jgi:hypothetical protein